MAVLIRIKNGPLSENLQVFPLSKLFPSNQTFMLGKTWKQNIYLQVLYNVSLFFQIVISLHYGLHNIKHTYSSFYEPLVLVLGTEAEFMNIQFH
jgi:hypothetical protein